MKNALPNSSNIIIKVENLGKCFHPRHVQGSRSRTEIWALRDVAFEVRQGECLGVIGHNGAGKTTLLKILMRITCPTTGRIEMEERAAGLLEAGAGFHPELTGRENIFVNCAMLGMGKREIEMCLDKIVDFAGVMEFLDLPVKFYSTGMRVRLAFAAIVHSNAEILLIDEVLAGADQIFQAAAQAVLQQALTAGKTVLLVSHNLELVRKVCGRVLQLKHGRVAACGPAGQALTEYQSNCEAER